MLRRALWKMIYGILDEWEFVKQLFDRRRHVEYTARCGLSRPPPRSRLCVVIVLRHHCSKGGLPMLFDVSCRKSWPRKSRLALTCRSRSDGSPTSSCRRPTLVDWCFVTTNNYYPSPLFVENSCEEDMHDPSEIIHFERLSAVFVTQLQLRANPLTARHNVRGIADKHPTFGPRCRV